MTVYVDNMRALFGRMIMCHMFSQTTKELNEMADKIGVARRWIQAEGTFGEHYDVCLSKRELAIKHGAVDSTGAKFAEIMKEKRQELKKP